ncbi:MAG: hypothetical protein H6Q90_5827 [Deltaproteobacteria bacterium]|nr:hypothetical protein [Deltaproteobacteria bacterium]
MIRGLLVGFAMTALIASCVVHRLMSPRLTGTCDGACEHYVACKPGHSDGARRECTAECPEVFEDRDSLMAYESLTCPDAVEYIDGRSAKSATAKPR